MTKQLDFHAVADAMHNAAGRGTYSGGCSVAELSYFKSCARRFGLFTTLIFTHDEGNYRYQLVSDPAHDRCWHLSLACRNKRERDAWLRAFFGEHVEKLWAEPPHVEGSGVWHWRVFCDESWQPLARVNAADLRAAGIRPAADVGVAIAVAGLAA